MSITFKINCIPRGQARVRHAVVAGRSRAYKTKDQQQDEATLQALMAPYVPHVPLKNALFLEITVYMPIPSYKSKKWLKSAKEGKILPCVKPDLSNIVKNIEDVMQSMRFFEDDKQICQIEAHKMYDPSPGYLITIGELNAML